MEYSADHDDMHFAIDIAKAYPEAAGAASYVRAYDLNRPKKGEWRLTITDTMRLSRDKNEIALNFMTWKEPVAQPDGSLVIALKDGASVRARCAEAKPTVEKYEFSDPRLSQAWTDGTVYRIRYAYSCANDGKISVEFSPCC